MKRLKTALFLCVAALACFVAAQAQQAKGASDPSNYYLGEVKMSSPTGQPYGSTLSLVKRTMLPAENKIVEVVTSIDLKGPTQEYTTVIAVTNSKFTVKDNEGTFNGTGELIGTPWQWNSWKYSVNMLRDRKGMLTAEDTLVNGAIVVKKSFYSPDKQLRVVFTEDLKPISREMYDILHAKLLVK